LRLRRGKRNIHRDNPVTPQVDLFPAPRSSAPAEPVRPIARAPRKRCAICRNLRPAPPTPWGKVLEGFGRCIHDPPWIFRGEHARCDYGKTSFD
jgi:hypothetical protein